MRTFTISEAAKISGLPDSTLRYYERIGLIEPIERDSSSKQRIYTQDDLDRIALIAGLNATGMSIEGMRSYLKNRVSGAIKAPEQIEILTERRVQLVDELNQLQLRVRYVEAKIAYWEAVERGDSMDIATCAVATYAVADEMNLPRPSASSVPPERGGYHDPGIEPSPTDNG